MINELSAKYLDLPMTNKKNGKVTNTKSQVQVRPLEIYEIAFPKEYLDVMMTTLFPDTKGKSAVKRFQFIVNMVKKAIGLKPIPKEWDTKQKLLVGGHEGVEVIGIGIKDDRVHEFKRTPEQLKSIGLDPKGDYESEAL